MAAQGSARWGACWRGGAGRPARRGCDQSFVITFAEPPTPRPLAAKSPAGVRGAVVRRPRSCGPARQQIDLSSAAARAGRGRGAGPAPRRRTGRAGAPEKAAHEREASTSASRRTSRTPSASTPRRRDVAAAGARASTPARPGGATPSTIRPRARRRRAGRAARAALAGPRPVARRPRARRIPPSRWWPSRTRLKEFEGASSRAAGSRRAGRAEGRPTAPRADREPVPQPARGGRRIGRSRPPPAPAG
jgi:hypothetical protein